MTVLGWLFLLTAAGVAVFAVAAAVEGQLAVAAVMLLFAAVPTLFGVLMVKLARRAAETARRDLRSDRARRTGVPGSATVRAMRDTGESVGDDPTVAFELSVEVPGRPALRLTHTQTVCRLAVGGIAVGRTYPCRLLDEDDGEPSAVAVEWGGLPGRAESMRRRLAEDRERRGNPE